MSWIKTERRKPKFGVTVLVYCRIWGRYMATYEQLEDTGWGNWRDFNGNLGVLPPVYWMEIPEVPSEQLKALIAPNTTLK